MALVSRILQRLSLSRCSDQIRSIMYTVKEIKFQSDNKAGDCPGVLQGNLSETKKGLIVLQEWWGVNETIKALAGTIAKDGGFVTLVPDLYRGKTAIDREEAGHLMHNLDWPGAVEDIRGAAKYLLASGCSKVGVTGFCMGGALSIAAAANVLSLSAAAPFYGIPTSSLADPATIKIPIQCHFGKEDDKTGFSALPDQEKLKQTLQNGGVNFEFHQYDGVGHAFNHIGGPNFDEKAHRLSLERLYKFMNTHLNRDSNL